MELNEQVYDKIDELCQQFISLNGKWNKKLSIKGKS